MQHSEGRGVRRLDRRLSVQHIHLAVRWVNVLCFTERNREIFVSNLRITTGTFSLFEANGKWRRVMWWDEVFIVLSPGKKHVWADTIILTSDGAVLCTSRQEMEKRSIDKV